MRLAATIACYTLAVLALTIAAYLIDGMIR